MTDTGKNIKTRIGDLADLIYLQGFADCAIEISNLIDSNKDITIDDVKVACAKFSKEVSTGKVFETKDKKEAVLSNEEYDNIMSVMDGLDDE